MPCPAKELLRNAAKARIRRMIAVKKHCTDLAVPPLVREQWEKGTREKDEMAQLLQDTNWDKDRQLTSQSLCQLEYKIWILSPYLSVVNCMGRCY